MGAYCCGALVHFLGLFHSSVCYRYSTAGHTPSRTSLESTGHAIEEPKRRGVLLGLILTSQEGLVGNAKIKENMGY